MNVKQFLTSLAVLFAGAITTSAQTEPQSETPSHPDCYNLVSISYRYDYFGSDYDHVGFNGFSADYIHGFSVSRKLPLYVETGGSFGYTTKKYAKGMHGGYGVINVPANCAYRFAIPKTPIVILPYVGLNFKLNVIGSNNVGKDTQSWYDDYDYKRFQVGFNIGVGVSYQKVYFGLNWGPDFNDIAKNTSSGTFKISLGMYL